MNIHNDTATIIRARKAKAAAYNETIEGLMTDSNRLHVREQELRQRGQVSAANRVREAGLCVASAMRLVDDSGAL